MERRPLKYLGYSITMQEVPNEISLTISISGCPYKCRGCHSDYLWEYDGKYILNDIDNLIHKYDGMITCVCFMGGDQNKEELRTLLNIAKGYNLKTSVYSGSNNIHDFDDILYLIDWLKIGRYDESLLTDNNIQYGIKLATSNQHIYKKGKDY